MSDWEQVRKALHIEAGDVAAEAAFKTLSARAAAVGGPGVGALLASLWGSVSYGAAPEDTRKREELRDKRDEREDALREKAIDLQARHTVAFEAHVEQYKALIDTNVRAADAFEQIAKALIQLAARP